MDSPTLEAITAECKEIAADALGDDVVFKASDPIDIVQELLAVIDEKDRLIQYQAHQYTQLKKT